MLYLPTCATSGIGLAKWVQGERSGFQGPRTRDRWEGSRVQISHWGTRQSSKRLSEVSQANPVFISRRWGKIRTRRKECHHLNTLPTYLKTQMLSPHTFMHYTFSSFPYLPCAQLGSPPRMQLLCGTVTCRSSQRIPRLLELELDLAPSEDRMSTPTGYWGITFSMGVCSAAAPGGSSWAVFCQSRASPCKLVTLGRSQQTSVLHNLVYFLSAWGILPYTWSCISYVSHPEGEARHTRSFPNSPSFLPQQLSQPYCFQISMLNEHFSFNS